MRRSRLAALAAAVACVTFEVTQAAPLSEGSFLALRLCAGPTRPATVGTVK